MNVKSNRFFSVIAASAMAAATLSACGGGGDGDTNQQSAAPGTITLAAMTDAPACDYSAVNVSVSKVRVHQDANAAADAAGWTELTFSPAKKINLLNAAGVLSGATTDLGEISLPPGLYMQMRLVFDANASGTANSLRPAGAALDAPLETAAELASTGYRIPIDTRVSSGAKSISLVDFDACASIQRRGATYVFKPRPRPISNVYGNIHGFIDKAALASNVVITSQQGGGILSTTVPNPATGEFNLPRLEVGNHDVVIQGKGRATVVIGGVSVRAGVVTEVSTTAVPLTLATSATGAIAGTISYTAPALAPSTGTFVAATQSINANDSLGVVGAKIITYRMQPVDLASGAYTLADLPVASIQFIAYRGNLPLVPANIATGLGNARYRVESMATGYTDKPNANVLVPTNSTVSGINLALP